MRKALLFASMFGALALGAATVDVTVREWDLATPYSRPPDLALWPYAACVLDPRSGAIKLIDVPTPKAVPYGFMIDSKGTPYFCEFGSNKIGRIDPATMQIRESVVPEGARPRRLALANDTTIYYSDFAR